ncbi:hypothetical protein P5F41_15100 [Clostridium perfringens]|nr:hypothetical protein [Clostridium perfringens]
MILSDITKRVIKVDDLKDIINIFQKNNGKNNEVNIIVGEFEKELCCEIEIIYPVGDRFDKEDIKSTNFKKR